MLTFGSLFSGIGGIDLGLERAGWTCKWQVEIDPFCRKVLEKHWPHVPKFGDIKELIGNELTRVDLLAGGFPCQDLSLAGKGAGLSGDRSGLWFEYLRIICTLRPRWVFVENVPGLFVRGIDTVLGGLAEAGYDSTWLSIQAADFGAPHRRERVCIVAHTSSIQCTTGTKEQGVIREVLENRAVLYNTNGPGKAQSGGNVADTEGESQGGLSIGKREAQSRFSVSSKGLANTDNQGLEIGFGGTGRQAEDGTIKRQGEIYGRGTTESLLGRVFDGFSRGLDRYRWPAGPTEEQYKWEPPRVATGIKGRVPRLKGLGNAVVPAMAELIGKIIMEVDNEIHSLRTL